MFVKSIAIAGAAGLTLGLTGLTGAAVAGTPQSSTHRCDNARAAAAHAAKALRVKKHDVTEAKQHLAAVERTHGDHSTAVKTAKAHVKHAKAEVAEAKDTLDAANAKKRHNCQNPQPTKTTGDTAGS